MNGAGLQSRSETGDAEVFCKNDTGERIVLETARPGDFFGDISLLDSDAWGHAGRGGTADGYGHGAVDVGRTALGAGASALGVATLGEALELRLALGDARIILLGPAGTAEIAAGREAGLELCLSAETAR